MAKIIPFKRIEDMRESIYLATDELFAANEIDYQTDVRPLNVDTISELLVGDAKTALLESQHSYLSSVEAHDFILYLWQKRTIAKKISDSLKGRHLESILPEVSPQFMIGGENCTIYDRSVSGQLFIGKNKRYEPADVLVTDRFLDGAVAINNKEYDLDPNDRLVMVDVYIHRSGITRYDSLISYALYPDEALVQQKHTRIFGANQTLTSYPSMQSGDSGVTMMDNMLNSIKGLNPEIN